MKLLFCFAFCITLIVKITAQPCSGSWSVGSPVNWGCFIGVSLNLSNNLEPPGCPINPNYTAQQTNAFTFTNSVSSFSIDFWGFSSASGCARLEIKINGIFYPLNNSNLSDIPSVVVCPGSFDFITLTGDGYLTSTANSQSISNGHGRIIISGVNASVVTISTNDPAGTIISSPFNCLPVVPLKLESFTGINNDCKALLNWKTGIEFNVKNIEIQKSDDGISFYKSGEAAPKGSNSYYSFVTANITNAYFRLKIIDLDGSYEYSEILFLKSSCNYPVYKIMPNPTNGIVEISGLTNNDLLQLSDITGRTITKFIFHQTNRFDLQHLAAGIYIVQVIKAGVIQANFKIVKL